MITRLLPELGSSPEAPFPAVSTALAEPNGLLARGGDLSVRRLVNAYRQGIFPWFMPGDPILWWSPDPRCVFEPHLTHMTGRMRRWLSTCDWTISADRNFANVIDSCAAPREERAGTWITSDMRAAYIHLHEQGYAHSIEVRQGYRLIGGLYGVAIGRMFFAESMFSLDSNGSKVALFALARQLRRWRWQLIDAQVPSPHLLSLGAALLPRANFTERVARLCAQDWPLGHWRDSFEPLTAHMLVTGREPRPDDPPG